MTFDTANFNSIVTGFSGEGLERWIVVARTGIGLERYAA